MKRMINPEKKAEILRLHFIEGISITDLCQTYKIDEDEFEKWKTNLFLHSDLVFKQIPDDGMDYYQNYDLVTNWLSQAFRGHTLKVLGIETAPIKRVCAYKPVEIAIQTGIIDVVFEDENNKCYHLEEQRNMILADLYRFASQHFSTAKEWKNKIVDIILISGKKYKGPREIKTQSGQYSPKFIDFTKRDGKKRLEEIRHEISQGDMTSLIELVFLPMYGIEKEEERSQFIEDLIRFEIDLLKNDQVEDILLAATMIMSNKIIDQKTFETLWEEIKMINIIKLSYSKGEKDGYGKGEKDGAITMVLEALEETIGVVPEYLQNKIKQITNFNVLKGLHRQAIKCKDLETFNQKLALVT